MASAHIGHSELTGSGRMSTRNRRSTDRRARGSLGVPADWVESVAGIRVVADDAPPGAGEMLHVASELAAAMSADGLTAADMAEASGVAPSTVKNVLAASVFIDVVTLARLEGAAGRRLWPQT